MPAETLCLLGRDALNTGECPWGRRGMSPEPQDLAENIAARLERASREQEGKLAGLRESLAQAERRMRRREAAAREQAQAEQQAEETEREAARLEQRQLQGRARRQWLGEQIRLQSAELPGESAQEARAALEQESVWLRKRQEELEQARTAAAEAQEQAAGWKGSCGSWKGSWLRAKICRRRRGGRERKRCQPSKRSWRGRRRKFTPGSSPTRGTAWLWRPGRKSWAGWRNGWRG